MSTIRTAIFGAAGLFVFGLIAAIWIYDKRLEAAQETIRSRDAEITALRREAAVQATLTQVRQDIAQAVQKAAEQAEERARATHERITEIERAPAADDGPVAPILDRTLDQLRRQQ